MANSIIMPKTGMAMESGVLVEWKVKQGDRVQKGGVIAIIETDKSTMELESDYDGVILALLREEGETVPVTEVLAWMGREGESIPSGAMTDNPAAPKPAAKSQAEEPRKEVNDFAVVSSAEYNVPFRIKATPAARRLAEEKGVDLSAVAPSGKSGEILAKDVAAGDSENRTVISAPPPRVVAASGDTEIPLTKIQQITGRRMQESRQTIPDVVLHIRPDISALLAMRKKINEQPDFKITINDFVLAATAKALAANPRLNSVFAGDRIIRRGSVNLGIAVATPNGLLVPVLRQAETLSLRQISKGAAELAERARSGKLSPDEMEGGTFTVSNLGMFGIAMFTPVINPPEAALLGVCAAEDIVKLENGKPVNHTVMGLSLAFDHRVVDGAEAAVFLSAVKNYLETPLRILL